MSAESSAQLIKQMSDNEKTKSTKQTETKFARVLIKEHGLTLGNFRYLSGAVAENVPLADAEFRESKGQLEILNVITG
ncbi:hypothetical protein JIN85_20765, partial [Luteolibacter pohnpeiensis]